MLTDCANTRCRNTCITRGGLGKTAWTIVASSRTVPRISSNNSTSPRSVCGGLESGSGSACHLERVRITSYQIDQIDEAHNVGSSKSLLCRTELMKKSCWFTYICTQEAPPLKSWRVCAQCYMIPRYKIRVTRDELLDLHASFSDLLSGNTCRKDRAYLSQTSRNTYQCFHGSV